MIHSHLNRTNLVYAIEPGSSAAARDSDWVDLQNYEGVVFHVIAEIGADADDVTLKLQQAKTNAAGSVKALVPRAWWRAQAADLTAGTAWVKVTTATCIIEGSQENLVQVEVDASELDVSNGFRYVRINHDAGGATGKLFAALAETIGATHAQEPSERLAAI